MSSRRRRPRSLALVLGSAAATITLAATALPAGAVTTVGTPQALSFSEWFAAGDTAVGITPGGLPYGDGNLYVQNPPIYTKALIWNGTTPVDITPSGLDYLCKTVFDSDAGVSVGQCGDSPQTFFVHSGSTTTVLPAGDLVQGLASNGTALVQYPDGAGTSLGLYSKGVLTRVTPAQPAAGVFWQGLAVNASGLVIGTRDGTANSGQGTSGLYAFSAGTATLVDPVWPDGQFPVRLSDSGYFVGTGSGPKKLYHGTVSAGRWAGTAVPLAAPAGGSVATVEDLNESGIVVGSASDGTTLRATRWSPSGALTFLSTAQSQAVAVNASGVAVGVTGLAGTATPNGPTIWTGTAELHPLAASKTNGVFVDISDTGKVVGWGLGKSDSLVWQLTG